MFFLFGFLVCVRTRSRKIGLAIGKTEPSTWSDLVVCGVSFVELFRTKTLRETVLQKKILQCPGTWLGKKQRLTKLPFSTYNNSTLLQYYVLKVTLIKKVTCFI
jgi:hypothetical protein